MTDRVKNGRARSRSEALREGVGVAQEPDAWLANVREAVARGIADADAGRVTDAETVFDRLIREFEAMAGKRKK